MCKRTKCNTRAVLAKCLSCDSNLNPDCATNPRSEHTKVCDNYKDGCFTMITKTNVLRGCFEDVERNTQRICNSQADKCKICSPTDDVGCNNEKLQMEKCVECYSSIDERCRDHQELFESSICDSFESKRSKGCYLYIVSLL